jgi:hypothetical protein
MVGDDEHGVVEGRPVSPPAVRVRIVPAAIPAAEHAPADHGGFHVAVLLAGGRHVACPALEPALAERSVEGPVRPRTQGLRTVTDMPVMDSGAHTHA